MSTDPNSGIALVEMVGNSSDASLNAVQFSGVLIAPDELLTVAHGVTDPDGTFRSVGNASFGGDGGATTFSDAITGVHVVDNSHPSDVPESDSQVASDFAVIHLAKPVSGAQIFSLGIASPGGTYQATGYPAVDNGARASITETLSQGSVAGELSGPSLTGSTSASGASGGPVYTTVNGTPVVCGLITAQDDTGGMVTSGFTAADIAQIDAWVYSDDASMAWGSAFSPSAAAEVASASPSTPFSTPPIDPVSADRLDQLSAELVSASSDGGRFSKLMSVVAAALTEARRQGASGSDIPDAAYQAAADIENGPSRSPAWAVAFLGGALAAESGVGIDRALGYVNNVFGLGVSSSSSHAVDDGFDIAKNFGNSTTSATISPAALSLASVLRDHASAPVEIASSMIVPSSSVFSIVASHRTPHAP